MIRILYVHGYMGDPYGGSFQKISKYAAEADFGGERVQMHTFDYDPRDPRKAVRDLRLYYYEHDIDLMIGSSLGGFLVASCRGARRIAVNPCWAPSEELPKVGFDDSVEDYITLENWMGMYSDCGDYDLCIGCFARNDELLGRKYRPKFRRFFPETYDIAGGHYLSDAAAKKIMTEIAPALITRFKVKRGLGHIVRRGLSAIEKLDYAHMLSFDNADSVQASQKCGCFFCEKIFPAAEVTRFMKEKTGHTALCPYCGIDSVLGDASGIEVSQDFLQRMHKEWFGN
jgi:hypothetical protein